MKTVCALGILGVLAGCAPSDKTVPDPLKRTLLAGPEVLSSLDVNIVYDPTGPGCVTLLDGQLPPPEVPGDYCLPPPSLDAAGKALPYPYQTGRNARVYVDLFAVGSKSSYGAAFPINGNISLSLNAGQVTSGTPTRITQGVLTHQKVTFRNSPGKAQLWAEAATLLQMDGQDLAPTFSMGASNPIYFAQPTLPDVQRTDNDALSPLDGQRVDLRTTGLMVTNVVGNGFTVSDLSVPVVGGLSAWNGLFVFAFNGVDTLTVGSRLLKLRGAITSFQGMTQLGEPEFVAAGGECAPVQEPSRYGREPLESEEGGVLVRARCPGDAQCLNNRCVPMGETYEYDRYGRIICQTPNVCGQPNAQCPAGTACLDREDWRTLDAQGVRAYTCQACPTVVGAELWTTPNQTPGFCGPIYKGDTFYAQKMRNESLEGVLLQVNQVAVDGLDLNDDFFRSGFESFGQWKLKFGDGTCATVTSESAPQFDVVAANTQKLKLSSFTGTMRQVRFKSGSAFWMLDLRHKDDLVRLSSPP